MAAEQIRDFLENGNIRNSVNFPALSLDRSHGIRLAVANQNVPKILGSLLSLLAEENINVIDMLNKSRDDIAYNLIDVENAPSDEVLKRIKEVEGIINVRVIS
jgi:D-3-phosphoglycerate dehydrogenase